MSAPNLWVAAVLHIKCGERDRSGQWLVEPTARYDCHRCGTTEGPVTGFHSVKVFAEQVKAVHASRCPAQAGRTGTPPTIHNPQASALTPVDNPMGAEGDRP